jgi:hypothetical protein
LQFPGSQLARHRVDENRQVGIVAAQNIVVADASDVGTGLSAEGSDSDRSGVAGSTLVSDIDVVAQNNIVPATVPDSDVVIAPCCCLIVECLGSKRGVVIAAVVILERRLSDRHIAGSALIINQRAVSHGGVVAACRPRERQG